MNIIIAKTSKAFNDGKQLFRRYAEAINIDLAFQSFDEELDVIDTKYNHPQGALVLAYDGDVPVGCAGVRKLDAHTAELKRMFVDPAYRGQQLGHQLLVQALEEAKSLGYVAIRLDTIKEMQPAIRLYKSFGFEEIGPYCYNPFEGAVFMEKQL
ncbi:GNAT family N-acetyltransferase [uncultured Chitinophaga sp.]|uniref:GNAT family N-acetyltransferase n=1 Tax=uncultured Chitinophaga sp. TaxID=339340 RepID=UPI0025EC53F1|nr:GNAT family N-acetyltransferase [uncultured Chitinophaga sp.]